MLRVCVVVVILALAFSVPSGANSFIFVDNSGLFSTSVPGEWVYQTQYSDTNLSVFYGPGTSNLVYFEVLYPIDFKDAIHYLDYVVNHFKGPGGLKDFHLEEGPQAFEFHGVPAASMTYTYTSSGEAAVREYRLIAILENQHMVSVTISDSETTFAQTLKDIGPVLTEWWWLF